MSRISRHARRDADLARARALGNVLLLAECQAVAEGLHRCFPVRPATLMRQDGVVVSDKAIQVVLQFRQRGIQALAKRHPIELVEQGLVEAFTDAVGLRTLRLRARVFDIFEAPR